MFRLLVRPHFDRPPPRGAEFHCEDWQCPQWMRCKHHFGRSYAYAAMLDSEANAVLTFTPYRAAFEHQCNYYELDKPRTWLAGWCEPLSRNWSCTGCDLPECPRRKSAVVPLAGRSRKGG